MVSIRSPWSQKFKGSEILDRRHRNGFIRGVMVDSACMPTTVALVLMAFVSACEKILPSGA